MKAREVVNNVKGTVCAVMALIGLTGGAAVGIAAPIVSFGGGAWMLALVLAPALGIVGMSTMGAACHKVLFGRE